MPRVALGILTLLVAAAAQAVVINNGSAPPDPDNVIDDDRYGANPTIHVRNVGCPPGGAESDPCPTPGAATEIELDTPIGDDPWALYVLDSSIATMTGGRVRTSIVTYDSASFTMQAGQLGIAAQGSCFCATGSSSALLTGGTVDATPVAGGTAVLTVLGGSINGVFTAGQVTGSGEIVLIDGDIDVSIVVRDSGTFTMSGGTMDNVDLQDDAVLDLSGGSMGSIDNHSGTANVSGGAFTSYTSTPPLPSTLYLSGGSGSIVSLDDNATANLSGGTLLASVNAYGAGAHALVDGTAAMNVIHLAEGDVTMAGGSVTTDVHLRNTGKFLWRGGSIGGSLVAGGSGGTMTVVGTGFQVDGSPVPYGPISQQTGTLSGQLDSGDPISLPFLHLGAVDPQCFGGTCNGIILLAAMPPGVPLLPGWGPAILSAVLVATARLATWRSGRRSTPPKRRSPVRRSFAAPPFPNST